MPIVYAYRMIFAVFVSAVYSNKMAAYSFYQ